MPLRVGVGVLGGVGLGVRAPGVVEHHPRVGDAGAGVAALDEQYQALVLGG